MSKKTKDPQALDAVSTEDKTKNQALARVAVSPTIKSAVTIQEYSKSYGDIDLTKVSECLRDSVERVNKNDLAEVEQHLMTQAMALDSIFHTLITRANRSEYLNNLKVYMGMALKAQSQCRATLEALAEIKNPKPFIQNNKAQYQQVNNEKRAVARAEKNSKTTNGLLEDKSNDEQWMDTGTPEAAGGNDKELEAVGAIDRP